MCLPSILIKEIILTIMCISVVSMIIFCGKLISGDFSDKKNNEKITIGYVAEEDRLTRLAISYVGSMESVKSLCKLKSVTYDEGILALESGEMSALIVLPENVMDEILSGSNAPATIYLPDTSGVDITGLENTMNVVKTMIFEELAEAGVGMLQTAQAQIYAITDMLPDKTMLQACYDDINEFNLKLVINRDEFFKKCKLSLTENNSYAVYFGASIFTIYITLTGILMGQYCKRSSVEQLMLAKKCEISYFMQLVCRITGTIVLVAVMMIFAILMLEMPLLRNILKLEITWQSIATLGMTAVFVSVYFQLVYQIIRKRTNAPMWIGVLAVLQAYMSGCIIPSVLLPELVVNIGEVLPSAYIKSAFIMLFSGNTQAVTDIVIALLLWSVVLFLALWAVTMGTDIKENTTTKQLRKQLSFGNSLYWILFRRMFYQKSFHICLLVMTISSVAVSQLEQGSYTAIYAAVYEKDPALKEKLTEYDGVINFIYCDSEKDVKTAVLKGEAECGYVLEEGIMQKLIAGNTEIITCYEDGDAIVEEVVNEVLFNIVFREAAFGWFGDYTSNKLTYYTGIENDVYDEIRMIFEKQLIENKTFDISVENIGKVQTDYESTPKMIYPVELVMLIGIILCGVQGLMQALSDFKKTRFYKCSKVQVMMIMVTQPVIIAVLVAGITQFLLTY